jgi:hypothetical protein
MGDSSLPLIMQNIILFIGIIVFGVVSFMAYGQVDRYLTLKAIDDCASAYEVRYSDTETNTVVSRPLEKPFRECIWQQGVTEWSVSTE